MFNPFNIFKRKAIDSSMLKTFTSSSNTITGKDSTSFAAIDLICSSFASLSGHFYNTKNRQSIKDHYLYELIQNPNIDETKFQFFYNSAKDYFNGNVYWYLYENNENEIVSIFRLNPNTVKVKRGLNNEKIFTYNGKDYNSYKILHIPSRYGYDGLTGKSIFSECNQIFSNTNELDNYINNSFNNSIGNRLIIDISKAYPDATDDQIDQLKNKFISNYAGLRNAGTPLIKSKKIEYDKIETDFKDNRANQLIENREFQEKEIAKLFGVPLQLLTGSETGNIETLYTMFIENSIRPIATAFEQTINKIIPFNDVPPTLNLPK
jgi:HK97 family phage portal protein